MLVWITRCVAEVRNNAKWARMRQLTLSTRMIRRYNEQHREVFEAVRGATASAAPRRCGRIWILRAGRWSRPPRHEHDRACAPARAQPARPVRVPGLPVLPPNMERHPVPGGGTRTLAIDAGDELTVIDREGRQPCELVVFDGAGRADPAIIGARGGAAPVGIQAALARGGRSARRVREALEAGGLDLGAAAAVRLFGAESRAGDSASFVASAAATLVIGAPGGPMPVDEQSAPSEIVLYVRRAARTNVKPDRGPPPPLAAPLLDVNIEPGTARAYEVKAGQLVQVVDVKGRECTDFQAFSLRALDRGREREIDPTTTRSLMGSLYPGPGLYSKYYTVDHEPLLELVQDTCGRHDTFGLACTARYYEDMGYPGHANCSDNMNAEGERFASARAAAGRRSISSTTPCSMPTMRSAWTTPGRVRATTCSCAPSPTSSASRPPVPATSTRPTAGTRPTSRCGCTTAARRSSQPRGFA